MQRKNNKLAISGVAVLLLAMLMVSMVIEVMSGSIYDNGEEAPQMPGADHPLRLKRQAGACPCENPAAPCCSKWGYCGWGPGYCDPEGTGHYTQTGSTLHRENSPG